MAVSGELMRRMRSHRLNLSSSDNAERISTRDPSIWLAHDGISHM